MTKQLTLDEMLDVAIELKISHAGHWQWCLEHIGTQMAEQIAVKLGVGSGAATFEGAAFAGTCAPFFPAYEGQECPEPLTWFDKDEWEPE